MSELTEIHLRDEAARLEYTIECNLETGLVYAWHITCMEPVRLQHFINIPNLVRPAGTQSPCQQKAQQQQEVVRAKIGPGGRPIQ